MARSELSPGIASFGLVRRCSLFPVSSTSTVSSLCTSGSALAGGWFRVGVPQCSLSESVVSLAPFGSVVLSQGFGSTLAVLSSVPSSAACATGRYSISCHDFARQVRSCLCPEGPWSCCVTMGACRLSLVPFQGNPRILVSSEVTYLPLIGSRCTDLAFRSRPPRFHFHVSTSDQDSRGNTRVLVHHPFCERKRLRCVRLPKDSHERRSDIIFHLESRHAPGSVTYQPSQLDTVTQQLFS